MKYVKRYRNKLHSIYVRFPSVSVNCFGMSRGELFSPCCFMVITTFLPHFLHTLYYCIKKSSSHFRPFPLHKHFVKPSFTFKWYFMQYKNFPKLFNQLWVCDITLSLFKKQLDSFPMEQYPYLKFCTTLTRLHHGL